MTQGIGPAGTSAERIPVWRKMVFGLGDHTVNVALSALALVFLFFLTEVAGMRPALAGLVIWIARAVDAVSDPLMGRISDVTRFRLGRRRPYFLIGALPFGMFFALLWTAPFEGQMEMFAYYGAIYIGLSLSTTILSVPYMALIPEMATSYDERTSLNTFRGAAAVIGTLVAAGMQPAAEALGGGAAGFATAGAALAVWLVLPWPAVFAVSFERGGDRGAVRESFADGIRSLARHATYRKLSALYINARIAVDLVGLGMLYFFTYWIRRQEDFAITLLSLMTVVVLSLPVWLWVARHIDKHRIFAMGGAWWVVMLLGIGLVTPEWPRWVLFAMAAASGVGYAVADLMPWAMLGEVIDEDELLTGQRREGMYNGFFTFLRKLGGASAFLLAGLALELAGYVRNQAQPEAALLTIRAITSLVPAFFLAIAIVIALRYPLTRARHQEIQRELASRASSQD
ncbi:MAG: glycoside-pentoside-hexuronide (GPH):cation symporter [Proteobacteria bacterium]|nr:glycoside-pentoside-hexuronide (GPH):cation symporter [Pseudomonadota bacterium]MCZ6784399.1 glycoside-pentoside-hexuronide (GPH):cation symporter [Pseudomonadota bacterium]